MTSSLRASLLPLLLLVAACQRDPELTHDPRANERASAPAPDPAPQPRQPERSRGLTYEVPPEWKKQQPSSNMRKAQYAVPDRDKAEGDAVFIYFGDMGGGVQGNVARWKNQFQDQPAEPVVEEFKAGAGNVTLLDISGTYATDMGGEASPDQRGLFAIVEAPSGDYIFRLNGPRGTVGDWREAFVEMLKKAKTD
jgi:hypothetical protein